MEPEDVTVHVHQIPVDVSIDCPACENNICIDYDEFCEQYDNPPNLPYNHITCPYCGQILNIEDQDWS